jgi:hypothetical protein
MMIVLGLLNRLLRKFCHRVLVVARDDDTGRIVRCWIDRADLWPYREVSE